MNKRDTRFLGLLLVMSLLAAGGCADFQKKILRKKKAAPSPRFFTEPIRRPNDVVYRERFTYWKAWQGELLRDLGGNHKKEVQDIHEARRHLAALPKYLQDEKAKELAPHLAEFDKLTEPLLEASLMTSNHAVTARRLEALRLRIEKQFSPKDMQAFLKPNPPPIDLSLYGEEEEIPLPSALRAEKERSA